MNRSGRSWLLDNLATSRRHSYTCLHLYTW